MKIRSVLGVGAVLCVAMLLFASAVLADTVMGDPGGVIAAKIEEAMLLGVDPAIYAGISVQKGATDTNRVSDRYAIVVTVQPEKPLTPEEAAEAKAAEIAAQNGTQYFVITIGSGNDTDIEAGELFVFQGGAYEVLPGSRVELVATNDPADMEFMVDHLLRNGSIRAVYP